MFQKSTISRVTIFFQWQRYKTIACFFLDLSISIDQYFVIFPPCLSALSFNQAYFTVEKWKYGQLTYFGIHTILWRQYINKTSDSMLTYLVWFWVVSNFMLNIRHRINSFWKKAGIYEKEKHSTHSVFLWIKIYCLRY